MRWWTASRGGRKYEKKKEMTSTLRVFDAKGFHIVSEKKKKGRVSRNFSVYIGQASAGCLLRCSSLKSRVKRMPLTQDCKRRHHERKVQGLPEWAFRCRCGWRKSFVGSSLRCPPRRKSSNVVCWVTSAQRCCIRHIWCCRARLWRVVSAGECQEGNKFSTVSTSRLKKKMKRIKEKVKKSRKKNVRQEWNRGGVYFVFPSLSLLFVFFLRTNAKLNIGLDLTGFGVPHSCLLLYVKLRVWRSWLSSHIFSGSMLSSGAFFFLLLFLWKCTFFSVFVPTVPVLLSLLLYFSDDTRLGLQSLQV